MRTPVKKLVSAVATSIAVMGAGQAAAEIKIGIAGPMTGPVAQYGDMQFSGAAWRSNRSMPMAVLWERNL